jgi:undecaprenyl-diphosphatase
MFSFDIFTNTLFSNIDSPFFNGAFYFASWLFDPIPFIILLALSAFVIWKWYRGKERKHILCLVLSAPLVAFVISFTLKYVFDVARPLNERLYAYGPSFPSGHTAVATAYFLILLHFARHAKDPYRRAVHYAFCILCPLFVGVSRLYFGVHWLSDVLVGYLIGALSVYICIHFFKNK